MNRIPHVLKLFHKDSQTYNPPPSLPYVLSQPAHIRLEVLDLLGRRIRILVDEQKPVGKHSAEWNGRDSRGNRVGSGMYLFSLSDGRTMQVRKVLLLH